MLDLGLIDLVLKSRSFIAFRMTTVKQILGSSE